MKFFLTFLLLSTLSLISCERHDFEETRKLHDEHSTTGEAHGTEHAAPTEAEPKAEH
jgi:hypothetical protein